VLERWRRDDFGSVAVLKFFEGACNEVVVVIHEVDHGARPALTDIHVEVESVFELLERGADQRELGV